MINPGMFHVEHSRTDLLPKFVEFYPHQFILWFAFLNAETAPRKGMFPVEHSFF